MIHVDLVDIKAKFEEIYSDPQEVYLWPSFHLGYIAGLMPEAPNLGIPGNDAHMIVAAHTGRISAEILKINKLSCERASGKKVSTSKPDASMYAVSSSPKKSTAW